LLNEKGDFSLQLPKQVLPVPDVSKELNAVTPAKATLSPHIKARQKQLEALTYEKSASQWSYAPDLQFRYQRRIGGGPADSHIFGAEISIPLWFWGNTSKVSAASHRVKAAMWNLQSTTQRVGSDLRVLKSKVMAEYELLQIFKTSLIPQALASYNSANSAYKASRISFLDFLDTERSLLKVEIARYRTLSKYIRSLTQLESKLGQIISGIEANTKRGTTENEHIH